MIDLFIPPVVRPRGAVLVLKAGVWKEKLPRAEYYRRWYEENREKRLQAMRDRYQNNKEAYKAKAKKWAAENRAKRLAIQQRSNRRAAFAALQFEGTDLPAAAEVA